MSKDDHREQKIKKTVVLETKQVSEAEYSRISKQDIWISIHSASGTLRFEDGNRFEPWVSRRGENSLVVKFLKI